MMKHIKKLLLKIKKFVKNSTSKDIFDALKRMVTFDFVPKLLCVFSALCLWFYVIDAQNPTFEKTFSGVEILFENSSGNPSGFEVLSSGVKYVDVELTGKKSEINRISLSDIRATVDISHITEAGEYPLDINVTTSKDASVQSVNPGSIYVYVDKPSSRSIPVGADYTGGTSDDKTLKIGELIPSKTFLTVSGPEEEILKIAKAEATVSVDQISHSVNIRGVTPKLLDANGNEISNPYITLTDSLIDVYVPVYMEKEVPVVPKLLHGYFDSDTIEYTATPSSVTIRGEVEDISEITGVYTDVIDDTAIGNSAVLQLNYDIPDGVTLVGSKTKCRISLSVRNYDEKNIVINTRKIETRGLHEELDAAVTKSLLITVCGPEDILENITANNITAYVSLGNYADAGSYEDIPVVLDFDETVNNVFIKNEYAQVTTVNITEKVTADE